jgi:aspartate carbamoyltransferase regulatory subunit
MEDGLKVTKIDRGTVLDHLPAGTAMSILGMFSLDKNLVVAAMNVDSSKHGKKDMIKIEGKLLSKEETDKIGLIAPSATINIIKSKQVADKRRVSPPQEVRGVLTCPNKKCITNVEECATRFLKRGEKYKCYFCESQFGVKEFSL